MKYWGKDRAGQRFGRLIVVKRVFPNKWGKPVWLCKCDCGNEKELSITNLGGSTNSCGCLEQESKGKTLITHGCTRRSKGAVMPEYTIWASMKGRCTDINRKDYGARGIKVCDRWSGENGFENFISDMGKRPSKKHSIDRFPDNDGNYEPSNCRWATPKQQQGNKRSNKYFEHEGERMIITDWAKRYGVCFRRLGEQLKTKSFSDAIHYLTKVRKSGHPKGTDCVNSRTIGRFVNGQLVEKYCPVKSMKKDGFNTSCVFDAMKANRTYKGYIWRYLDDKAA